MARAGSTQFLDIGPACPRQNTHQVAQAVCPGGPGVYVDHDAIVLANSPGAAHKRPRQPG